MESTKRFLTAFIFVAGLVTSNVFCALRSKMASGGVINDASDVTWAHAVNSKDALEKALAGPIDFLEADVSLGHVQGMVQSLTIPIMAHPPERSSDISLDTWLNTVVTRRPEKGIKLDFKSIEVVEPSLIILQKYSSKLNSSVWLNADVLPGPINSSTTPVLVEKFLGLCQHYFPDATLSIGWTTHWYPTFTEEQWHYSWQHVREMADVIRCRGYENDHYPQFTFPVRAIFASRSITQLQWLVGTIPNSTLTVWSGKHDPLELGELLKIRKFFPKDKVYYDVPDDTLDFFTLNKNDVYPLDQDLISPDDGLWMTFTRGQGESCSALTYTRNGAIVFGKSLMTTTLKKRVISLGKFDNLKISGKIQFFDTTGDTAAALPRYGEAQELMLVLADVSLFSKNTSQDSQGSKLDLTVSDTDVIWSAVNSSAVYTFRHIYGQEKASCRLFKLDTSQDKSFEVWTVPCYEETQPGVEKIPENAISEISSRKRLVLPKGPFLLGFVSAGNEHVAIYDIKVEIQRAGGDFIPLSKSPLRTSLGFLTTIVSLFCALCILF